MPAEHSQADGRPRALRDERRRGEVREHLDGFWPVAFAELKRKAHRRLAAERDGYP